VGMAGSGAGGVRVRGSCRTWTRRPDADVPWLACALMAAAEGGLLLAKALRDVAPLEAALDTVIDHITALAAKPV
jgi:hypothetical protein